MSLAEKSSEYRKPLYSCNNKSYRSHSGLGSASPRSRSIERSMYNYFSLWGGPSVQATSVDRESTRALYLQRKFQRQRTSKASTVRAASATTGCVSGIPTFLVIKVMEKPRTQGDSTQSKVCRGGSGGLQAPCRGATVLQNHENSKHHWAKRRRPD